MINDGEVTLDKLKSYGPFAASHPSGTNRPAGAGWKTSGALGLENCFVCFLPLHLLLSSPAVLYHVKTSC